MTLLDLELLCDKEGNAILKMLSSMCHEKAEFVSQTWQDNKLANCWTIAAHQLDEISFPY